MTIFSLLVRSFQPNKNHATVYPFAVGLVESCRVGLSLHFMSVFIVFAVSHRIIPENQNEKHNILL